MPTALQSLKNSYLRIRFPWRTRILAGVDLHNNRFFERPCPNGGKPRRTVEFTNKTLDWVDYAGVVDPQWHQWLRSTREHPPSVQELLHDQQRKENLKGLVARADARWEAKGRLTGPIKPALEDSVLEKNTGYAGDAALDRPGTQRKKLPIKTPGAVAETTRVEGEGGVGWGGAPPPQG